MCTSGVSRGLASTWYSGSIAEPVWCPRCNTAEVHPAGAAQIVRWKWAAATSGRGSLISIEPDCLSQDMFIMCGLGLVDESVHGRELAKLWGALHSLSSKRWLVGPDISSMLSTKSSMCRPAVVCMQRLCALKESQLAHHERCGTAWLAVGWVKRSAHGRSNWAGLIYIG
jgi:hypothetical protein